MIWWFVNILQGYGKKCEVVPLRLDKGQTEPVMSRMKEGAIAVTLDPNVASVFSSSNAVSTFLRSVIATMSKLDRKREKAIRQFHSSLSPSSPRRRIESGRT